MSSDIHIMQEVKSGDFDKLGLLFERYKLPLLGYFYRQIGNREYCEDLVQNVFMRMLKYRHTFDGYDKFTTWMYTIARNVAMDHFKKNNRYQYSDELSQHQKADAETDEQLIEEESIRLLSKALMQLSPEKKQVLVMSKYQGIHYKEIGEIIGCSEGAVKLRVFRAMQELKKIYKKLEK